VAKIWKPTSKSYFQVTHAEFLLLLKGGAALDMNTTKPKPFRWMLDVIWLNLVSCESFNRIIKK